MIHELLHWMQVDWGFKIPLVFTYFSVRMILAAVTAFVVSLVLGPFFIRKLYSLKIGQTIRTEDCPLLGQLHQKKQNTPTMGGILILFSLGVSAFLWMDLHHVFTWLLFLTLLVLGFLGGYDDYLKLKYKNTRGICAKTKLIVQIGLGIFVAFYLLFPSSADWMANIFKQPAIKWSQQVLSLDQFSRSLFIPFVKDPYFFSSILAPLVGLVFVFVIVGASNSVNLTDGLDGLAAGCVIMVAFPLIVIAFVSNHIELANYLNIAYIEGSGEIAIFLASLEGACLGFLWYNAYPAQVFMGDTGSLTLGGIIGLSAVLLKRELLLAVVGGIFVVEALSVILQVASYRYRNKKRIFLIAPLHHHFEYKGLPETKIVIRFWIVGLIMALIGIASLKFQ